MVTEHDTESELTPEPHLSPIPASAVWLDRSSVAATAFFEWLSRPRVRLTLTGVTLLMTGGLVVTSSVWTLPLVIAGVLMVVIAWIGRRVDGRLAVQWGEAGTELEFRARIKAAEPVRAALQQESSSSRELAHAVELEPDGQEIIEGEAHTVEIDIAELKALISAAELTDAGTAPTDEGAPARNLRVAHGGARSSDAARG